MADTKISALTAAGALAGTEAVPIVQGGATVKTTVQTIANLAVTVAANTQVLFNDGGVLAGDTGLTFNKTTNVLTASGGFASDNGTLVSAMTDTWNNAGTVFSAIKMNVTDTASAALSRLFDLQIGGVPYFQVRKDKSAELFNAYTSDTNFESGGCWWSANVLYVGTKKGSGGGTARDVYIKTDARQWTFSDAAATFTAPGSIYCGAGYNGFLITNQGGIIGENADGIISLVNNAQNGFGRLAFGRADNANPALSPTTLTGGWALDVRGGADTNGQAAGVYTLTELLTIAAAATSTTTIQKPANSIIVGVSVRVTVALPITSTFTVGDSTLATRFSTAAVSKAVNSTDKGTKAGAYYNATAEGIIITPDTVPSDATGRVRVTIHYINVTPPTS